MSDHTLLRALLRDVNATVFTDTDLDTAEAAAIEEWADYNPKSLVHQCVLLWGATAHSVQRLPAGTHLSDAVREKYQGLLINSRQEWEKQRLQCTK